MFILSQKQNLQTLMIICVVRERRKLAILAKYFAACGAKVEFEVVTSAYDVSTKLNQI